MVAGTILARGRRTITTDLRAVELSQDPDFSRYHQVFNRAASSARRLAGLLLAAPVQAFIPPGSPLTPVIDETRERRWGSKIAKRGHYRDPLASSRKRSDVRPLT